MIRHEAITLNLTAATGSQRSAGVVNGRILAVHFNFDASYGVAAVTTLTAGGNGTPSNIVVAITGETDAWYYPRHQAHADDGSGLTFDATEPVVVEVPVADYLNVTVTGGTATKSVTVTVIYEQ